MTCFSTLWSWYLKARFPFDVPAAQYFRRTLCWTELSLWSHLTYLRPHDFILKLSLRFVLPFPHRSSNHNHWPENQDFTVRNFISCQHFSAPLFSVTESHEPKSCKLYKHKLKHINRYSSFSTCNWTNYIFKNSHNSTINPQSSSKSIFNGISWGFSLFHPFFLSITLHLAGVF